MVLVSYNTLTWGCHSLTFGLSQTQSEVAQQYRCLFQNTQVEGVVGRTRCSDSCTTSPTCAASSSVWATPAWSLGYPCPKSTRQQGPIGDHHSLHSRQHSPREEPFLGLLDLRCLLAILFTWRCSRFTPLCTLYKMRERGIRRYRYNNQLHWIGTCIV